MQPAHLASAVLRIDCALHFHAVQKQGMPVAQNPFKNLTKNLFSLKCQKYHIKQEPVLPNSEKSRFLHAGFYCISFISIRVRVCISVKNRSS